MNTAVFQKLNTDLATGLEVDAIARSLAALARAVAAELGPSGQSLLDAVERLNSELRALRAGFATFEAVFSGQGTVARRLKEAAMVDELLYGPPSAAKVRKMLKVLAAFDYRPSKEASHLHDMHHFCQHVFELCQPDNLPLPPYEAYPVMSPSSARTGFYTSIDPETSDRLQALVLTAELASGARATLFTGTIHPTRVFVFHPQEYAWVLYEGTCVLPGLLESLEAQLDVAYQQLKQGYENRDWTAEFEAACVQAQEIFKRANVLPMRYRTFLRLSPLESQICVDAAGLRVRFASTTGDYPSETVTVMSQVSTDGGVAFTTALKALDVATQCRLVSAVKFELGELLRSIEQAEKLEQLDAVSP